MKALDTNVLVRFLTHDSAAQWRAAERQVSAGAFVPDTVLLELEWVLRGAFGLSRHEIDATLSRLVRISTLHFADRAAIAEAILLHRDGLDFGDAMHAATSFGRANALRTFDKAFVNKAKRAKTRLKVEGV